MLARYSMRRVLLQCAKHKRIPNIYILGNNHCLTHYNQSPSPLRTHTIHIRSQDLELDRVCMENFSRDAWTFAFNHAHFHFYVDLLVSETISELESICRK